MTFNVGKELSPCLDAGHRQYRSCLALVAPVVALMADDATVDELLGWAVLELGAAEAGHSLSPRADLTRAI